MIYGIVDNIATKLNNGDGFRIDFNDTENTGENYD